MDTAIVVAIVGIMGTLLSQIISSYFSTKRDQQQWMRTQESQRNEWLRSRLLEIYSNCIEYLSKIPDANDYGENYDPITKKKSILSYQEDVFNEAHKWLYMLLVFIPSGDKAENLDLFEHVTRFSNMPPAEQQKDAPVLREKILRLAKEDPRVK